MSATDFELQMTTFFLNDEEYAVDVMKVREIINMPDVTKAANAPPYVEGIINLRGRIVPIISLRKRLGLPEPDAGIVSCIAIMDFAGELTGFIIDEVSDVIRIRESQIEPPAVAIAQPWISGILNTDKNVITVVDLSHLA